MHPNRVRFYSPTVLRVQNLRLRRTLAGIVLALALSGAAAGCGGSSAAEVKATETREEQERAVTQKREEAETAKEQHKEAVEAAATKKREAQEHREEAARQREEAHQQQEAQARASQPKTVPSESDQRLDVAEEELESQGWHFKVVGGGLFGVVVKSDWTVCESRPGGGAAVPASTTIRLIVARSCP